VVKAWQEWVERQRRSRPTHPPSTRAKKRESGGGFLPPVVPNTVQVRPEKKEYRVDPQHHSGSDVQKGKRKVESSFLKSQQWS